MEFSKEIIAILDYLCQKFGIAIDWTSENVMPYLEELCGRYIQYEIYTSIAWIVLFGSIAILAGLVWAISGIVHVNCRNDTATCILCFSMIVFWVALALLIIVGAFQAFDIIECYTIPEKTILEYLKTLMDNASNR